MLFVAQQEKFGYLKAVKSEAASFQLAPACETFDLARSY